MTTADLICVMNLGKIEQVASPQEIYDRPASEFVARFIGMSNVFKGKTLDGSTVSLAGTPLRQRRTLKAAPARRCRSPASIELLGKEPADKANIVPAKVLAGLSRLEPRLLGRGGGRHQFRLITAASESIAPGASVWLQAAAKMPARWPANRVANSKKSSGAEERPGGCRWAEDHKTRRPEGRRRRGAHGLRFAGPRAARRPPRR